MNTKSNNPDLGAVECDGCGGFAAVRQQKTGKKYLYLHCKNCAEKFMSDLGKEFIFANGFFVSAEYAF